MRFDLQLFADYFQFYLQDEQVKGDLSESWTEEACANLLALAPSTIGVGTVRNMMVSVTIEVADSMPSDTFDEWDHVTECSIEVPSGKVVVAGCTDYFPEALGIPVTPGTYRARIYYGRLDTLSENGLDGDDHYKVVLWRDSPTSPKVFKRRIHLDRGR